MIASHYAVPLPATLAQAATLFARPDSDPLAELPQGAELRVLDKRGGWAWGYAGGLVGYVSAAALAG